MMKKGFLIGLFIQIIVVSLSAQNTPAPTTPSVPYSRAIEANGFLYISGHLGTKDGKLMDKDIETEVNQAMQNIGQLLTEHKLSYDDIVSIIVYLKDMAHYDRMNAAYRTFFNKRFPTRTCIQVAALPRNGNVEISAIAVLPPK
jgi:2-iminobutanoate/2-iminopropanoate deaminase